LSEKTHTESVYSAFFEQKFSTDLVLVIVWVAAAIIAIYLPILNDTPLRIILSLPIIVFIPGYCLVAALFPQEGDVDLLERILLSIGISIAIAPLIGLGLNFTPWGIRLEPIVVSLTLFTWLMILIAQYRRAMLPSEKRFGMPASVVSSKTYRGLALSPGGSRFSQYLNVLLSLVAIIAVITTAYVIIFPKEGERFTGFYILGQNQTISDYPREIIPGVHYPMYIGVENHERRDMNYTIETWMLLTRFDNATNTTSVIAMEPDERIVISLGQNESAIIPYTLSSGKTGYNRVEFLLFTEDIPHPDLSGSDRINASYRDLHLWVTTEQGNLTDQAVMTK
jgi:uncharacterized membrane protein